MAHRTLRLLPLLAAALALMSCETIGMTGKPRPSNPQPADPPPAAVCAPIRAEPLPPAGIDRDTLDATLAAVLGGDLAADLVQWRDVDWPAWARDLARRLERAQGACDPPPDPKGR